MHKEQRGHGLRLQEACIVVNRQGHVAQAVDHASRSKGFELSGMGMQPPVHAIASFMEIMLPGMVLFVPLREKKG